MVVKNSIPSIPAIQSDEQALGNALQQASLLANLTKICHWNVTGENFYSMHLLFEEQYKELDEHLDVLAELMRSKGFFVTQNLGFSNSFYVGLSKKEMLDVLIGEREEFSSALQGIADAMPDDLVAVDVATELMRDNEKAIWMLTSSMGKD